ncbi:MAG: HPr family phosphocarrier protein [Myxococcales bacterium]|nr:HPr family phosphocarrier protein [Myxococcales bacterium]MDH5567454.1 HPr family phosphocarrier protein [Myxococcales bacterium]
MNTSLVHEAEFEVRGELGLHARPAGQFVALAARFASRISVGRGEEWVDGRSILSLLSLAAGRGTKLRIRAEGVDAAEAVRALGALLEALGGNSGPASAGGRAAV